MWLTSPLEVEAHEAPVLARLLVLGFGSLRSRHVDGPGAGCEILAVVELLAKSVERLVLLVLPAPRLAATEVRVEGEAKSALC